MAIPRPPLFGLKILVCAQNEWYTKPIPARCNARSGVDTVISINGVVFLEVGGPKTPHLEDFLRRSVTEVRANIERWLENHSAVSGQTTGIVIMDIEHPYPKNLYTYDPSPGGLQDQVIDAFATRAEAARQVFPNATLGFFGTLVPDPRGRADATKYKASKAALVRAGQRGMFDHVDCLVPVVYPHFVPNDVKRWNTYAAYTRLAITGSRDLSKSDGTKLPVIPFLTCWIANATSKHAYDVLLDLPVLPDPLDATLGVQFDVLLEERVRTAVVWVGRNTEVITLEVVNNPHARTVSDHICFRGPPRDPLLPS